MEKTEMDSIPSNKRPSFVEVDGLPSFVGNMEAGFSGNQNQYQHPLCSRPLAYSRRTSFRNLSSMSGYAFSPRSGRFHDSRFEESSFLKACFFCKRQLGSNKDIFMYRGNIPFCSVECREEQIKIDEAKEKNWNMFSMKALRKKEQSRSTSPNENQDYPFRTGTVVAA